MTFRSFRRKMRQAMGAHDWLEGILVAVGLAFVALAVVCVWGLVVTISSWGEADGGPDASVGFLSVTRGLGVALFGLFAFLSLGVGWFLAGAWIRRVLRRNGSGPDA